MPVNATGILATTGGAIMIYSAIKGKSISGSIRSILAGQSPATAGSANPISGAALNTGTIVIPGSSELPQGTVGATGKTTAIQNMSLAKMLAASYGWTANEWSALTGVINDESGGRATAQNASGALGIAQALGHGNANTGGTLGNEYGGYGLTDAQAKAANSGNAYYQLVWMLNYIKQTYGTPSNALAHENAYHWY